jgi:hypothetical protein
MKTFKTGILCLLLLACCFHSLAQVQASERTSAKPLLFNDMPEKTRIRVTELENLLNLPVGTAVNTFVAPNFPFQGSVVSVSPPNENSKTVVIRSTNRKGASLIFTRTKKTDGSIRYFGRIVSLKNEDALEIVKEGDQYLLQKKKLNELITE